MDALDLCPSSSASTAIDPETTERFLFLAPCKRWQCEVCGPRKKYLLSRRIIEARPNRFLTLTVRNPNVRPNDPDDQTDTDWEPETPREAYDRTRRCCSELFKEFRRRGMPQEYVRILEQTKKGYPHYHYLMRGDKPWPQAEVSRVWKRLTGSYVVDIQWVGASERQTGYVTKYLAKGDSVDFTSRRVSSSRGFFKPKPQTPKSTLTDWSHFRPGIDTELMLVRVGTMLRPTDRLGKWKMEAASTGDEVPEAIDRWLQRKGL
jgi:hypothetical protein